ncbi:MAG: FtsX-like permease family protein [Nostoc sp. DedVER02]|uniref:FtsX-like permease family protein n=1 Tax=unclassified Nostoc TaxID=2593658 RepID=UPI002AD2D02F|nr:MULTISPECIES: FtsX-like permease family protein [unclassified Nostoc]MDZ7984830.1 FtsX-like permease family protein [Nostoc sp. DedVER02]MDZ8113628.1 FtsX-like permease family protein [Nostoc sp. DedVER01b]
MIRRFIIEIQKIPIAWLQLRYQRNQTIAGIVGIFCITFLIFMQLGLRNAFLEGALQLPLNFNADIVLVSSLSSTVLQPVTFSSRPLYQALALKNVESVAPLYITSTQWYDRNQSLYRIRVNVIGIPSNIQTLNLPGLKENIEKLNRQKFALFDRNARNEFSPIITEFNETGNSSAEVLAGANGSLQQLRIVGLFELGVNNAYDASFIINPTTFSQLFGRSLTKIDAGLIKLKPDANSDANIKQTVEELRKYLPANIKIFSKSELIAREKIFHESNSPMGFIFRFILIIAIIISIFILYQILYVKVTHNLANYATLKALGLNHNSLVSIVFQEAIFLVIAGYIPGAIISCLAYDYLVRTTKIFIQMTIESGLFVLGLVCMICIISAGLSLLKVKDADPVDVFK